MKKIDLGQAMTILANVGVIAGIVLLALELQQNNHLLRAQARAERASVAIDANVMRLSNPEVMQILYKAQNGEGLTDEEQFWVEEIAWGVFVRLQFIWGEYEAGLIDREAIPTEDWRNMVVNHSQMTDYWRENKDAAFRGDFVRFMDENILNER